MSNIVDVRRLKDLHACTYITGASFSNVCSISQSVKIKVKVKFTLEQATKAQRGSRGTVLLFNLGARWGGWSTPHPGHFTRRNGAVPIV